ncbi:MAG: hypothetical protein CO090_04160 [Acidobacteria bacterium CG_4_9_14_3_um_filter_49_7]|nr:MAG: hypothetical protein CO090_04160 [Acidobacteria bacterium CG_4_9_14_3_um_filter_49_7]
MAWETCHPYAQNHQSKSLHFFPPFSAIVARLKPGKPMKELSHSVNSFAKKGCRTDIRQPSIIET